MSLERPIELRDGATVLETWGTSGPSILCVHGITSSRRSWTRLGERLAQQFRVFAYDQRGHGDAAMAPGPMTLERSVADLEGVFAAVGGSVDLLIGHSWGGAVALLAGRRIATRRVLAIDPMIGVSPGTFDAEYVDDLRPALTLDADHRPAAIRAMYEGAHPADVAGKLHAMLPMSIGSLERLGRDNRVDDGGWDLRETLVDYPLPLRLLIAGEDSVVSPDDLTFVRERGGPHVSVRVFAGEGHNLHRTAFEEFAAEVAGLVR